MKRRGTATPAATRNRLPLLVLGLLFLGAPTVASAGDPLRTWRTLESAHFVISYHDGEEPLAQRLAVVAEDAHRKLVPLFDHAPRQKTEVVLSDETDDANGYATVLPYANLHLYATAPDDRSELNDYDDWLSELIIHEYSHILHTDTIHGVARVLNWVLGFGERGTLYAPNTSQPAFILEGIAVLHESGLTGGGRHRSSLYDMWLRTATLEGKLQRLDQFSNGPLQFPRGGSAHFYGAAFIRWVTSRYGTDLWRRLSHDYGGAWIPGGVNRALRRIIGRTWSDLYVDFRASLEEKYRRQRDAIAFLGITPSRALTGPRDVAVRPIFTRDGREVIWSDYDNASRPQLRRVASDGSGRPRTLLEVDAAGGSTLSPDGGTLYFDAGDIHRNIYFYRDLYALDLATGEKRRLTSGLRAAEPDLSPDGRTLAFDVNDRGSRSLVTMPAAGGPLTYLLGKRDDLSQVYTPAWSPDGRTLAFSWWRDGGYRDLWTIDVATRALTRITADRAIDMDPRWSPDGELIYFSSDRGGVYNLYAFEPATQRTLQVTNLVGGAFDVAISPDGRRAVYVGFVADGWRLETIDLDPATFRPALPALLDRPDVPLPPGGAGLPSRPYQPLATLWPRTLSFTFFPDAFGQTIGFRLGGSDVVGQHAWALGVDFSLARWDAIQASAIYVYQRLFPTFTLSGHRTLTRRGGLYVDGIQRAYIEDDYSATAAVTLPVVRRLAESSTLSFGYNFAYLRHVDRDQVPLDPDLITTRLPETGRVASLGITWGWSNVRRYTFSISNEKGRQLGLRLSLALRGIGSQHEVYSASWSWTEYVTLGARHVLALSYAGGLAGGDLRRRGVFSVGGYAPQPDPLRSLVDFTRPGRASLRGYPYGAFEGDQMHVLNAEYRFPIWAIERGHGTLPVYLKRLHGALFADFGSAFSGAFDPRQFRLGAGTELRLETQIAWYLPVALQLGYARGFMTGGEDQVYLYLNNPF